MSTYKLTQYSHGAGCGCKISPKVLTEILGTSPFQNHIFPELLVGNDHRDDAAVYDLGDGTALISTTDFFMPIVDDPQTFGYIASVNAISDVYAMGGRPLLAIAILGWPVDKLPPEAANGVVEGARAACAAAQIPLAGGHSIDSPEPIFGLAVTGRVDISRLKKNNGAQAGDLLYLTKPLGVGIYTTAMKKGLLTDQDLKAATESMMQLNSIGEILASVPEVHAMTDVTGFGLAGHLLEMCEASAVRAELKFSQIPLLHSQRLNEYLDQGCVPGGTHRNFASYGDRISAVTGHQKHILCDPQTSGGLLLAISSRESDKVEELLRSSGMPAIPIGQMHAMQEAGAVISVSV